MGLRRGYKWIGGLNGRIIILNTAIVTKIRVGHKQKLALLDFAASSYVSGSGWEYQIRNLPIMIYDQKVVMKILQPCSSKDIRSELILNFGNKGAFKHADIYFVLLDSKGNFYSYPDWQFGIVPFLRDFSIPGDAKIDDVKILDIAYPSTYPPIEDSGYYTF